DRLLIVSGVNGESCKNDDSVYNPAAMYHGDLHSIGLSQMLTGVSYIYDGSTAVAGSLPGGYAGGISVDQYIASKIGGETKFPSLELGVITTTDTGVQPFSRMISAGPNQPVPPSEDPAAAFQRIFSDGTAVGGATVDQALAQRKSVLDFVADDLVRLEDKVGASDRLKLDAHLTAIRDLETRLGNGSTGGATASCDPSQSIQNQGDPQDKANFPVTGKLHMDVLALALKCDVTRVASLQWSWARSNLVHTWAGATQGHHDMSHAGASGELSAVNTWYAEQLAYLAGSLAAAEDVDGTNLLDNTVIYWCSEVAWGYVHSFDNLRVFLLGSCGGALNTGQDLALTAQPHQKLLVTLMNAMGVMENEFGDTSYGTGPLPGVLA
ncbi:MAG TPA: DUF1552 domain-containing protein, partial [Polyangiaceae bacterium]|nr:DUF1552 domain-containing protein [Polyangiaceae bacterium]